MTPTSFTFLLTLPCHSRFVPILRELAGQAVTYSEMDKTVGAEFTSRVEAAAERVLGRGPSSADCQVRVVCDDGELSVAFSDEIVRQRVATT